MTSTSAAGESATATPAAGTVDLKLEVVVIPVSDVDRAKEFYGSLGWRLDADFPFDNGFRVVQFTPPGSRVLDPVRHEHDVGRARLGPGPLPGRLRHRGCARRARRARCRGQRGVPRRDAGRAVPTRRRDGRVSGPGPDGGSYRTFATLSDPDGNGWLMQEITTRLPGRIDAQETTYASLADLANAMRRAEAAHGEHEKRTGVRDENWPGWYAAYMVAEQAGTELPS